MEKVKVKRYVAGQAPAESDEESDVSRLPVAMMIVLGIIIWSFFTLGRGLFAAANARETRSSTSCSRQVTGEPSRCTRFQNRQ